jgi:hypothetical protein
MRDKARVSVQPQTAADEAIQAPARIGAMHLQDRETSKVAGAPRAWRVSSQLEAAYRNGRLGATSSEDARRRLGAGEQYTRLWDASVSGTRDSTAAFDFCGGGLGVPLNEAQRAAIRRLVAIEMHLGYRDRTIVRAICAYGHTPSEAIALAKLPEDTRTSARVCESLDALVDAIERTHRHPR